jgi:hypothetical protein
MILSMRRTICSASPSGDLSTLLSLSLLPSPTWISLSTRGTSKANHKVLCVDNLAQNLLHNY